MPGTAPAAAITGSSVHQSATASPLTTAWTAAAGSFPRVAGQSFLVAAVCAEGSTSVTAIGCSTTGWTQVGTGVLNTKAACAFFWKWSAGADAVPVFTSTLTGTAKIHAVLYELSGVRNTAQPWDTSGTATGTTANPLTVTTGANVTVPGGVALAVHSLYTGTSATDAWTKDAAWTAGVTDAATATMHAAFDFKLAPATGAALADGGTWGAVGTFEAAMSVVFAAAQAEGWGQPL
jgi:hypothetical protein